MTEFHLHLHLPPDPRLDEILRLARESNRKENLIMADLEAINLALDTLTSEVSSAAAELDELAQAIRDVGTSPQELAAVADRISTLASSLHDATARNDVVSPPPTPDPVPPTP